ncbi:Subtilase family protein [Haladaptatus litoreus]|uniref:Subtilase family protein n=1 Tax=Haladaptatus litoreus TaxID=553468 RepID=A0A1N7DBG3_9EURY|nr:S8 family serine peptidase [Haladaptatus litoreus]SIR73075.1 Subtilase family protein [Haladaptatus litoreus]
MTSRGQSTVQPTTEYIVGTTSPAAVNAAQSHATAVKRVLDFGNIGQAVAGRFPAPARDALRRRNDVRYVEKNGLVRAVNHGTTGRQVLSWGADRINSEQANHKGYTGKGAHIAILDTGIDSDHPDLQANLGDGKAFYYSCNTLFDGRPCSETETNDNTCHHPWDDDDDHGTIVAAIAGAINNDIDVVGVAPEATLHALKVLDCRGIGDYLGIAEGIKYTADQGWDIANMSLAGAEAYVMRDACKYAYEKGVLLVGATGNRGCEGCVSYPAAYPEVIAVTASTSTDTLADISSTGPEVELTAPGRYIRSVSSRYPAVVTGTSAAAPHVSATAALLMANGYLNATNTAYDASGSLTQESYNNPGGVRGKLRATAEDIGLTTNQQGYGLVDAEAAIAVGQRGSVSTNQPNRTTWESITSEGSFTNPVALMGPPSTNGGQPCHMRVREVTDESFEYQLEEWAYLDGSHTTETAHYLFMNEGAYTTPAGLRAEVGSLQTDQTFTRENFFQTFTTIPIVISQAQTVNEADPVVTRNRNVSSTGFDVRLQEETSGGNHASETIGYIAIEPGISTLNGVPFEAGLTSDTVTHNWASIAFQRVYEEPVFIANLQTYDGSDPAALRYQNLGGSAVDIRVEEEQSVDTETGHTSEVVSYLVFEGQDII